MSLGNSIHLGASTRYPLNDIFNFQQLQKVYYIKSGMKMDHWQLQVFVLVLNKPNDFLGNEDVNKNVG